MSVVAESQERTVQTRWLRVKATARAIGARHALPLAVVLAASGIAQLAVLRQGTGALIEPDSISYLTVARQVAAGQLTDPLRTPGYPAFLDLMQALGTIVHHASLRTVVLAQAALVVSAAVALYALVYLPSHNRFAAAAVAALVGINLYIVDWERIIRVEAMSYVVTVVLLLAFARFVLTDRRAALVTVVVLSAIAILIRPNDVYFPAAMLGLMALRRFRLGRLRARWKDLALGLVAAYAVVGVYIVANGMTTGYLGLTDVTNMNAFGKVLEYHMQNETDDPRYARVRADANAYVVSAESQPTRTFPEPFHLVVQGPMTYVDGHYALLGAYARSIISHHPVEFALKTASDVTTVWAASPTLYYAPFTQSSWWTAALLRMSDFTDLALWLLPLLLVVFGIGAWRHPEHPLTFVMFTLLLLACANVLLIAVGSYNEFYRLRAPMDFVPIMGAALLAIELGARAMGKRLNLVWLAPVPRRGARQDELPSGESSESRVSSVSREASA